LTISDAGPILGDCHVGDSIAVNGACLTVTRFDAQQKGGWFEVWLANETLERTDLGTCCGGNYRSQSLIHDYQESGRLATRSTWSVPWVLMSGLEDTLYKSVWCLSHPCRRSYCLSFEGHVDDTATLISKTPDGDSLRLLFQLNEATPTRPSLLPYLIPKGYIALDGTSLTLTEVDDEKRTFGVMLIQHTQEKITLARKNIGSKVNIEVDMVGKYVEKSVTATLSGGGSGSTEWQRLVEKVVEGVLSRKGI
jgi:riboflavin synthase